MRKSLDLDRKVEFHMNSMIRPRVSVPIVSDVSGNQSESIHAEREGYD